MKILIYILLVLTGVLLLTKKTKVKKTNFIEIILIVGLCLICYFSPNAPDMSQYSIFYTATKEGSANSFLGYGWYFLCRMGTMIGLDYITFKTIIFLVGLLFIRRTVNKLCSNPCICWAMYIIFPAILDCIQIRFFFASSLIILVVPLLFKKRFTFMRFLTYTIVNVVAMLVHNSCLFYFILLVIPFVKKYQLTNIVTFFVILVNVAFLVFNKYIPTLFYMILPDSQARRIAFYFNNEHISLLALLVYSGFFIIHLILFRKFRKSSSCPVELRQKYKTIELMNLFMCLSIPFVYLSSDFMRLQRGLLIINYCFYADLILNFKKSYVTLLGVKLKNRNVAYLVLTAYYVLFMLAFNYQALLATLK